MKKVSVIVPAYNSHDTLARCLGSLVNQTLQDIEIIVVNDASTDDTWDIMRRCEAQFPDKVIIINSDINRGAGGARNQGLDMASGEYIGLVDSDDFVAPNMYETLYNKAMEADYDIVDSGYYQESTDKARLHTGDDMTGILDADKRSALICSGGYLVTRIFKNKLWNEPRIRMREKVLCLEDSEILTYMLLRANSIGNVKEIFYKYCDQAGSATKDREFDSYSESIYGAMKALYDVNHGLTNYEASKAAIEYEITQLYSFGVNRCLMRNIQKYGADKSMISMYYKDITREENKMLAKYAELTREIISIPYKDNKETSSRIDKLDIMILNENDKIHK